MAVNLDAEGTKGHSKKNYFNISNQNLSKGFKGLRHASKPRLSAKRVAKRDAEPLQQRGLTCRGQPPCKGSDGDGEDLGDELNDNDKGDHGSVTSSPLKGELVNTRQMDF